MDRMHRDAEDATCVPIGQIGIGRIFSFAICALLILLPANHIIRLKTGTISWFGTAEIDVRGAPGWMHTPVSTNLLNDEFGLSIPMPAWKGQNIVVRYDLSSRHEDSTAPHARIAVTCSCPGRNWHHATIRTRRSGELVLPVRGFGFYNIDIWQSAGPDGEKSSGDYRWGVRSGDELSVAK